MCAIQAFSYSRLKPATINITLAKTLCIDTPPWVGLAGWQKEGGGAGYTDTNHVIASNVFLDKRGKLV